MGQYIESVVMLPFRDVGPLIMLQGLEKNAKLITVGRTSMPDSRVCTIYNLHTN